MAPQTAPDQTNSKDAHKGAAKRVFTTAPGSAFLDTVAKAILSGDLPETGGPKPELLDLPDVRLILPTPRAARAMQDAFLRASGNQALLLPRIQSITESDDDLIALSALANDQGLGADAITELPPAIDDIERKVTLTQLVLRWSKAMARRAGSTPDRADESGGDIVQETPAQAAGLAGELAQLMDIVEREGASLAGLQDLVPENFSAHWQATLDFLKIVTEAWPLHLKEQGKTSKVARRNAAILAEAQRLAADPPDTPVIIAGITGSIPATAELMKVVATLPQGAIILPGLDQFLDDASWQAIAPIQNEETATSLGHPEHPQYGLKKLLDTLGLRRQDVKTVADAKSGAVHDMRRQFVSEALRPSTTTKAWRDVSDTMDRAALTAALDGIHVIDAPSAQDEAEAIALILREVAETPGRTAALVSPDRILARRVGVRLESWGIRVDDSAGRPFIKTAPGTFLDLVVAAISSDFAPKDVVALLKHPLARLELDPFTIRKTARALEVAAFRTPYLGRGLDGIADALHRARLEVDTNQRQHKAARRIHDDDWDNAHTIVERLKVAFAPLTPLFSDRNADDLKAFVRAHIETAERLARHEEKTETPAKGGDVDETTLSPLWTGAAGDQGSLFFANLLSETTPGLEITAPDYADLYRSLLVGLNIRERNPVHPRLSIWGLFESRLQQPDVIILGSLNEGVWPKVTTPGPWLNRAMRHALKLPSPEEDIGREALDFATLMGAETVYLTRAEKTRGDPTVPSRWLLRMRALLAGLDAEDLIKPTRPWAEWAHARDDVPRVAPIAAPAPCPPVHARPRVMSVSNIERWIKNPYGIFAHSILDLAPLDPLGRDPGPDLRGRIIHDSLARFSVTHPVGSSIFNTPDAIAAALVEEAQNVISDYKAHPRIAAFWLPRIKRFATWFAQTEPKRRQDVIRVIEETKGTLVFETPEGPFKVTARADRIDVTNAGLVITDYKTGAPPTDAAVESGKSPQLILEAAITLFGDGFDRVGDATTVKGLRFISASGGIPPGEEHDMLTKKDIAATADGVLNQLKSLVACYDRPETPYAALRRQKFDYRFDDFEHLARVGEWSGSEPDGGDA